MFCLFFVCMCVHMCFNRVSSCVCRYLKKKGCDRMRVYSLAHQSSAEPHSSRQRMQLLEVVLPDAQEEEEDDELSRQSPWGLLLLYSTSCGMTEHIQREKETLKHQFHVGLMMHSSAERTRIRPTDRPTDRCCWTRWRGRSRRGYYSSQCTHHCIEIIKKINK